MADPFTGMAANTIQQGQSAGFFSPTGSPQLLRMARMGAVRTADNSRRRNALLSRLMGLDPNQARVAAVNADANASANTADAINQAQYGQLQGAQAFGRGLFNNQLGVENQRGLMKYQNDLNRPTVGGVLGGLAGQFGGGLFGAYGNRLAGG